TPPRAAAGGPWSDSCAYPCGQSTTAARRDTTELFAGDVAPNHPGPSSVPDAVGDTDGVGRSGLQRHEAVLGDGRLDAHELRPGLVRDVVHGADQLVPRVPHHRRAGAAGHRLDRAAPELVVDDDLRP